MVTYLPLQRFFLSNARVRARYKTNFAEHESVWTAGDNNGDQNHPQTRRVSFSDRRTFIDRGGRCRADRREKIPTKHKANSRWGKWPNSNAIKGNESTTGERSAAKALTWINPTSVHT
jgi:hypothetical protein